MKKTRGLAVLNVIAFIIQLLMTYMVQFKMLGNKTVGEISDDYANLFTPADFTFAVWGIIYTCLGIFCVYHIVMAYKRNAKHPANKDLHRIDLLFIITNLASAAWLVAWTYSELLLSVLLILVQLVALITVHSRLHIHSPNRTPSGKLATELPLSMYFGWITVATIANIASWLVAEGWDGWNVPASTWTMIMLIITIGLGIIMVIIRRVIVFGLVIMWGLYGILTNLQQQDGKTYDMLITTCWSGIAILGLCCIIQVVKSIVYYKRKPVLHPEVPPQPHASA